MAMKKAAAKRKAPAKKKAAARKPAAKKSSAKKPAMKKMAAKRKAPAKRKACHCRNSRLARLCRSAPIRDKIAKIGFDKRLVRHFLDVGPGSEGFVAAGDEHASDPVVGIESLDCLGQFGNQGLVEGIEGLRPVEANNSDAAFCFDNDVLVSHG